jgi:hypothetical protein
VAAEADNADICTVQQIKVQYCHQNGEFLLAARQFSLPGAANFWLRSGTQQLTPVPLRCQNRKDAVTSLQILSHRGQFCNHFNEVAVGQNLF